MDEIIIVYECEKDLTEAAELFRQNKSFLKRKKYESPVRYPLQLMNIYSAFGLKPTRAELKKLTKRIV